MLATTSPTFAGLLRRYRRERGLTQEELAERAGLAARTISDLERGLPDPGLCFAPALSVRTAYLGSLAPGNRHRSLSSERHFAGCAPAPAAASYQL